MPEYTLGSGAKLVVNQATYKTAAALRDIVLGALKGNMMEVAKLDVEDKTTLGAAMANILLEVSLHPQFDNAIFACGDRAAYSAPGKSAQLKVNEALFDDKAVGETARGDQMEINLRIVEVNVLPFLKGIFSRLKTTLPQIIGDLKSGLGSTATP